MSTSESSKNFLFPWDVENINNRIDYCLTLFGVRKINYLPRDTRRFLADFILRIITNNQRGANLYPNNDDLVFIQEPFKAFWDEAAKD